MGGRDQTARWLTAAATAVAVLTAPVGAHAAKAKRADLSVKSAKVSVSSALPSRPVDLSATVKNGGKATAKASTLRGYLTKSAKRGKGEVQLLGKVATKSLKAGTSLTVKGTVMVPATTPTASYRVVLCADDADKVKETSEKNNCAVVPGPFTVSPARTTPGIVPGGSLPLPGGGLPGPSSDAGPAPGGSGDPAPGTGTPGPGNGDPGTNDPGPAPELPGGNDPVPASPAPPTPRALPAAGTTTTAAASAFLYEGAGAVQTGVDPDDIDESRAGVLRGKVLQTDGTPLPGVTVTVTGHPELGQTVTRADGHYDLAVNGGANLTLHFERPTYLPADRLVPAPVRAYDLVDELVMKRFDTKKTDVTAGAPTAQVATSTTSSDSDGSRRANLIFLPDTHATMTLADGTTKPMSTTMTVRATEYTVGQRGEDAMPSDLPASSGYTYAVDYTVDEAVEAGATRVSFDKPVVTYTDNFLGFPVGGVVPAGSYDTTIDQWRPEDNGVVLKIVAVTAGSAQVDVTGDGVADTGAALTDRGITAAELQQLAGLYEAGKTLWRVQVTHFSAWDYNWPFGPPPGSDGPKPPKPPKPPKRPKNPKDPKDPCKKPSGSWVECDSRGLREQLPIAGTPYTLNYNSDRAVGRRPLEIEIPITGAAALPASLKAIELDISIAGRSFSASYAPAQNLTHLFVWDGKDAYGRLLRSVTPGWATISFVYDGVYQSPAANRAAFNRLGGQPISGDRSRGEIRISKTVDFQLGSDIPPSAGLGGWSLSANHALDTNGGAASLGNGDRRIAPTTAVAKLLVDENEDTIYNQQTRGLSGTVWQPDGSIWFADVLTEYYGNPGVTLRIRKVSPDGKTVSTVSTFPVPPGGTADAYYPVIPMTAAPDGGVYVLPRLSTDKYDPVTKAYYQRGAVVWHVSPTGVRKQITAGSAADINIPTDPVGPNNAPGPAGDGQLARDVVLDNPTTIATAPDGSLYIGESANSPSYRNRIQQITPDGVLRTVWSSNGIINSPSDGQKIMYQILGLAIAQDGAIYIQSRGYNNSGHLWQLAPSGVMKLIVGDESGPECCSGGENARNVHVTNADKIGLMPTGEVVFASNRSLNVVRADGRVQVLAGNATTSDADRRKSAAAIPADFSNIRGLSVAPDGRVAVTVWRSGLRTVEPGIPGFSFNGYPVPVGDGSTTAVFDVTGRHTKTVDSLTGQTQESFAYEPSGELKSITDRNGRVTTIERDGSGKPTAIVAPGGERTTVSVDADGNLASVARPGQPATTLTYKAGGLLTKEVDAGGGTHNFAYDTNGFLITDQDPDGITTTVTAADVGDTGSEVKLKLPSGRTTTYLNEGDEKTGWSRKITSAAGAVSTAQIGVDGKVKATSAAGVVTTVTPSSDPRFGALQQFDGALSVKQPSGLELTASSTRTTDLFAPTELFAPKALTHNFRVDGSTVQDVAYDGTARTVTRSYAGNVKTVRTLDAEGRPTKLSPFQGADDIEYTYNAKGQTTKVKRGSASTTYEYDASDRLAARTDALGRKTSYTTDAAGRTASVKVPGGQTYTLGYDALDRMTGVTMPSGAAHALTWTPAGRRKGYKPPGSGAGYVITRDGDGLPSKVTIPGGRQITNTHDAGGRLASVAYPEATTTAEFVGSDQRLASLTRTPAGGGAAAKTAWTWDGSLVKSVEATGPSVGKYTYTYDNRFRLTNSTVTAGGTTKSESIDYYGDNSIYSRDGYTFNRGGPLNGVTSITGNGLSSSFSWDGHGRVTGRADSVGGSARYAMTLTRDDAGRIAKKVETAAGVTRTFDYAYDLNGRVIQVKRDGVVVEAYTYDQDGNRVDRTIAGTTKTAAYETSKTAIDTFGGVDYTVSDDGFLTKRGTDTFTWSARAELLSASVAGGTTTYAYDSYGRRVATTTGGQTTSFLYGNPAHELQVTGIVEPDGTLTTLTYNDAGFLLGFRRGGTHYNVATDQVGSPAVVTTDDGAIVKAVTYSAFGEVLSDTAPSFRLPLGYAGGVADPASGFVRMGVRDYDPATGRFVSRDPIGLDGGDANLYAYVGGDPIQNSDPTGLVAAGGTVCEGGVCGGVKWGWNDEGFSICGEVGLGVGNDISFNPLGGPENDKIYVKPSFEVGLGPIASLELGDEVYTDFSECRKQNFTAQVCVLGACVESSDTSRNSPENGDGLKVNPEKIADVLGKAAHLGMEAKMMTGYCRRLW